MSYLIFLQFGCLLITSVLALLLGLSRLFIHRVNRDYEVSRWIVCSAMVLAAVHYLLQLVFGFRSQGDDIGAVINILFYAPVSSLIGYSIVHLTTGGRYWRQYVLAFAIIYAAILAVFAAGCAVYDSLHMPHMLIVMEVLYVVCVGFSAVYSYVCMRPSRRRLISDTASDLSNYDLYIHSGLIYLYLVGLVSSFAIFSGQLLLYTGPLMMLALLFYIVGFVSMGFQLSPIEETLKTENAEDEDEVASEAGTEPKRLNAEQIEQIEQRIADWIAGHGYADQDVSIYTTARRLGITKEVLTLYLSCEKGVTFRIWLSAIRLEQAKQLLIAHPEYCNEAIAEECGFTSRNYFQSLFKAETGFTPREYVANATRGSAQEDYRCKR